MFVSITRGARWVKMNNNMPNVAVHDLLVHPRDNDLVLGTYGRDIYITNVGALQDLTPAVLDESVHLFSVRPTVQRVTWSFGANDYLFGQRHLSTPNEPNGMLIRYYLKSAAATPPVIAIATEKGMEVARLQGSGNAGINTVMWNTRPVPPGSGEGRGGGPAGRGGAGRGGGATRGGAGIETLAPLGNYTVTLEVAGERKTQPARIAKTQGWSIGLTPTVIR